MEYTRAVMGGSPRTGQLPVSGTTTLNMRVFDPPTPLPCTLTLDSTNAGRAIQISTDGGANFYTPTYDTTQTAFINVAITAPITHVKFTGAQGDNWSIC